MKKILSIKRIRKSFKYAFNGILLVLRKERNIYIFFILSLIALFLGFILKISLIEWSIIIMAIAIVFAFEFLNTFVEMFLDIVKKEYSNCVKKIKDVYAGATLVVCIAAFIIAVIIFIPKIIRMLGW